MTERDEALAETAMSPGPPVDATAADPTAAPAVEAAAKKQIGRYRIDRELGVGGMGIVHAAFDPELERPVAVKLILRATSEESRKRLLHEARAMARLTHANIITIYEIGSDQGRDFVAMELVDGGSLSDWLRTARRSTGEVLDAFIAAGRGLAAAHAAGIVHRDFKPHNVLRSHSGRIVVGDFGLATGLDTKVAIADIPIEAYTQLTATGSWVGTPAYMAPEQWNGGTITAATDQFAFCVALWEGLAGQRPFHGDTVEQLRAAVTAGPAKLDSSNIPLRLRPVLRRGLDPDPARRWPSMDALLAAVRPDRRKLYVGLAAIAGLGLSASVVALALTRGPAAENKERREADGFERIAEQLGEKIQAETLRNIEQSARKFDEGFKIGTARRLLRDVRRLNDGRVTVPQELITELVEELDDGKQIQLVPTKLENKPIGLKAYAIKPGTFADAIGLSNGDIVVAIDGHPVTTSQELEAALTGVDSDAAQLQLDVLRNLQHFTIVVKAEAEDREVPEPPETPVLEPPIPPTPPPAPPKVELRVFE